MDLPDEEQLLHTESMDRFPASEEIPASLARAAAPWLRRGYRVQYTDPYLVQLLRRDRPRGRALLLLMGAAFAVAGAAISLAAGLRRRTWHVVSIATGPDGRILTHTQRSPTPLPTE